MLTHPNLLTTDKQGTTYIGDPPRAQFFVYAPDGKFLRTLGRRGKGPGEYRYLTSVGWTGDTLWMYDMNHQCVTYYTDTRVSGTETANAPQDRRTCRPRHAQPA